MTKLMECDSHEDVNIAVVPAKMDFIEHCIAIVFSDMSIIEEKLNAILLTNALEHHFKV